MNEVYVNKNELNEWIAKYFKQDLISISELLSLIEDLDSEINSLNTKISDMERDIEENYRPISKAEQYNIDDRWFH